MLPAQPVVTCPEPHASGAVACSATSALSPLGSRRGMRGGDSAAQQQAGGATEVPNAVTITIQTDG